MKEQIDIFDDLLIEFDEMGFVPTNHPHDHNREYYAIDWKNRLINALEGYRKQSVWISVEDRLPEEDGNYITFTNATSASDGVIAMKFVTATVRGKKVRRWEWSGRISQWVVTHWMPLPEPPKGE